MHAPRSDSWNSAFFQPVKIALSTGMVSQGWKREFGLSHFVMLFSPCLCGLLNKSSLFLLSQHLVIPVDKEVHVISRDTWELQRKLSEPSIEEVILSNLMRHAFVSTLPLLRHLFQNFSVLAFSACGTFLAAATVKGEVVVWEFSASKVVERLGLYFRIFFLSS